MAAQDEWRWYVRQLCEAGGFFNPERHPRYFHFTVWNSLGGDPFRSISDISQADIY
jgi:hypothetical protein